MPCPTFQFPVARNAGTSGFRKKALPPPHTRREVIHACAPSETPLDSREAVQGLDDKSEIPWEVIGEPQESVERMGDVELSNLLPQFSKRAPPPPFLPPVAEVAEEKRKTPRSIPKGSNPLDHDKLQEFQCQATYEELVLMGVCMDLTDLVVETGGALKEETFASYL